MLNEFALESSLGDLRNLPGWQTARLVGPDASLPRRFRVHKVPRGPFDGLDKAQYKRFVAENKLPRTNRNFGRRRFRDIRVSSTILNNPHYPRFVIFLSPWRLYSRDSRIFSQLCVHLSLLTEYSIPVASRQFRSQRDRNVAFN